MLSREWRRDAELESVQVPELEHPDAPISVSRLVDECPAGCLDPRSRRIVEARWLRETDQATLHDLAAEFGVSAERIRQIENKAMQKMRGIIGAAD